MFIQTRKWIDFSSPEVANGNWEQLIRLLYGKPLHEKPRVGLAPKYISSPSPAPTSPVNAKFSTLKQAFLHNKPGLKLYRDDFLEACYEYVDALRNRDASSVTVPTPKTLELAEQLLRIRDNVVDWVLLEASAPNRSEFCETLTNFLERLLHLKARPKEITTWNGTTFSAHALFVYETFLYTVASLIKAGAYDCLHEVLLGHYLLAETEANGGDRFSRFDHFWSQDKRLNEVLGDAKTKYYNPTAELLKRHATRPDIAFIEIIQADYLCMMMSCLIKNPWYPQTCYYYEFGRGLPLFVRATQKKYFRNLAIISGIDDPKTLKEKIETGAESTGVSQWGGAAHRRSFLGSLEMDKWATL